MRIVFAGERMEVIEALSRKVCGSSDECLFYAFRLTESGGFAEGLERDIVEKRELILSVEVFVFDYRMFEFCDTFLYKRLGAIGQKSPVVFYNDPFAFSENRVSRWIGKNKFRIGAFDYNKIIPFLVDLSSAVDSPELSMNIEIFQSLASIHRMMGSREERIIDDLKRSCSLPPSLAKLLSILCCSRNKCLSVDEISSRMNLSAGENGKRSVYSYISRLKRFSAKSKRFELVRTGKGRYKVFLHENIP